MGKTADLQARYAEVFGKPTTNRNTKYLETKIAKALAVRRIKAANAHEAAMKDLSAPAAQRPRTESGHILCGEPSGCSVCRAAFPAHVAAWNADYDAVQAAKAAPTEQPDRFAWAREQTERREAWDAMQADWDAAIEEDASRAALRAESDKDRAAAEDEARAENTARSLAAPSTIDETEMRLANEYTPIAIAQKKGAVVARISSQPIDEAAARAYGIDLKNLLVSQPDTGAQAREIGETLIRSGAVDWVIFHKVEVPQEAIKALSKTTQVTFEDCTEPAAVAPNTDRDPRLPPANTVLQRALKDGKNIEVIVNESDFTFGGKTFKSLSAIAKQVTGTPWNGFLFFGLTKRAEKAAA